MTDGRQADNIDAHPPLNVWCADMQAGGPVLSALRQRFDLYLCADLADAGARVSDEGADILLLNLSPTEILCRDMSAGALPGVALTDWQAQAQEIIALNRRNRRKVRIVDIRMARDHPAAFLRWFGLSGDDEQISALSHDALDAKPDRDEILHLLAQCALQGDMSARLLRGELEAVSLNFAEQTDPVADDPDAAFLSYQDMRLQQRQGEVLQTHNRATQEEVEVLRLSKQQLEQQLEQGLELAGEEIRQLREQDALLQAQNRTAQEEAEVQNKRRQQLEQDLELAGERTGQLRQQSDALQAHNRATQEEVGVLRLSKQQFVQDLEQAGEEIRQLREQDELLQAQNQTMQQELEVLAQGRTQLEQRLEQVNQGIESYQVQVAGLQAEQAGLKRRNTDKEQALQQAGEMLRGLEMQVTHLTRDLQRAADRQARKQQQIEEAEEGLRRFLNSRSYRLTAPLRTIRALFRGGKPRLGSERDPPYMGRRQG